MIKPVGNGEWDLVCYADTIKKLEEEVEHGHFVPDHRFFDLYRNEEDSGDEIKDLPNAG